MKTLSKPVVRRKPLREHACGPILVGTAGWGLPSASQHRFATSDPAATHLQRYSQHLPAVEINSSFYRSHQRVTYERWAAATPSDFRFCVKLPRSVTHSARLKDADPLLQVFLHEVGGLGARLGCLLVQLPPSLAFERSVVEAFLRSLRYLHGDGGVVVEPRHASWFTPEVDALLAHWQIARVLADPVLHDAGRAPGGWPGLVYCRLHGSPRVYYSAYEAVLINELAARLQLATSQARSVWCMFDNTASGAAADNALDLLRTCLRCIRGRVGSQSG